MKAGLRRVGELVKPRIALAAAASALAVFIPASPGTAWRGAPLGLGVFLLACGAGALNQLLERRLDGLMERTQGRPLPSGRLAPDQALAAALALLGAGLPLIILAAGAAGGLLAAAAVFWYDGVYTGLKRVTAFAVVPGALVGAVPPVLGWLAAGRPWQDPRLLALCFFFTLWQVPHFWLLLPGQAADLRRAGFPSLGDALGERSLARLCAVWMCTAAGAALLLPVFGALGSAGALLPLCAAAGWLTWKAATLLRGAHAPWRAAVCGGGERPPSDDGAPWRAAFAQLNAFVLLVMVLLSVDPYL